MLFVKRLSPSKMKWLTLVALFPLWGIGALQLLMRSVQSFSGSECGECLALPSATLLPGSAVVSFLVALTCLSAGMVSTLRLIWQYQSEQMPRAELIREVLESETDYDSPIKASPESGGESYTRLWYLSLQNHLRGKFGYDTLKLSPLKRWPAILKNELGQDLIPVWNGPLLLLSLLSIPALALIIAALDLIVAGVTGVSFCQLSYQIMAAAAVAVSTVIFTFPLPVAALALLAALFFGTPRLLRLVAHLRKLEAELKSARNGFTVACDEELVG